MEPSATRQAGKARTPSRRPLHLRHTRNGPGVTDKLWEMTDVVPLVEEKEAADARAKREAKESRDSSYGSAGENSATKGSRRFY